MKSLKRKHTPCTEVRYPTKKLRKRKKKFEKLPPDAHHQMIIEIAMYSSPSDPEWPKLLSRNEKAIKVNNHAGARHC